MTITNGFALLCGLALFLYGVSLMGDGLNKVAGNRLQAVLYRLTDRPIKGMLLGAAVTAVIQSSTATSIIAIGFINSGMMQLSQAVYLILGSIFGSSITGWLVALSSLDSAALGGALSVTDLTALLAVIGIWLLKFQKSASRKNVGVILLGFAVLMTGMNMMSAAVSPLRDSEAFVSFLVNFSHPALGVLAGMAFTAAIQSSAAAIGILQALSVTGAITFSTAFPIVLGVAVGGAVPVLLGALGAGVNARRTAVLHLAIDVVGACLCGVLFYALDAAFRFPFTDAVMNAVSIAAVNTLFRLFAVLALAPAVPLLERLSRRVIRDPEEPGEETRKPAFLLEERFLAYPALALEQCREAIGDMARYAADGVQFCAALTDSYSDEAFRRVEEIEEICDAFEDSIGASLTKITRQALAGADNVNATLYYHVVSSFERVSDDAMIIARVLRQAHQEQVTYSEAAQRELRTLQRAIADGMRSALSAFGDPRTEQAEDAIALALIAEGLCEELHLHHIARIREGTCSQEQGLSYNDILSQYENIATRCRKIAYMLLGAKEGAFDSHAYHQRFRRLERDTLRKKAEEYREQYSLN